MTQRPRRSARSSAPQRQLDTPLLRATSAAALSAAAMLLLIGATVSAVLLAPGRASAVCTPDPPMDDDSVTCTDEVSTGYDVSGAENLDISVEGNSVFDDTGAGLDSAIRIGQETSIEIGEDSIISVTLDGQFGIQGDDNNFVNNGGTITVSGDNARGISLDDNTTGVLPNGGVNGATGQIFVSGNDSVALEGGENSGLATSGLIDLTGDRTIGVSAGNRVNLNSAANVSNAAGTINVSGADAFGIKAGDDWIDGNSSGGSFSPQLGGIRNLTDNSDPAAPIVADINVSGDRATGIFAGDETNIAGDHNSFVRNGPLANITVTGEDAIGISVGGNNRLEADSLSNLFTIDNAGSITGDDDAGALIEIRNFVVGFENRILNDMTGEILADTTNLGTANRGIAISGSGGDDLLENLGAITGDVLLDEGDDQYIHGVDATLQDTLDLGEGNNSFRNSGTYSGAVAFGTGDDTVNNSGTFEGDLDVGDGDDTVENFGTIDGNVLLGQGDDTYSHGPRGERLRNDLRRRQRRYP